MAVSRLNLLAVLLVFAPWRTAAQQRYNSTDGYACNGAAMKCSTFAMYRTFQAEESLQTVGSYFNTNPAAIANVSDLAMAATNAPLPQGHALYIPLDCRCENGTSQMPVTRTIAFNDTFWWLSITIYGGLTKYQAMERFNPTKDVFNLTLGDTIRVPIFCACPTAEQVALGTALLLTYVVYADETLESISRRFGIATADLSAANQVSENETLDQNTTLLVPLTSLPPIATLDLGRSPAPNPSRVRSERREVGIIAGVCTVGILAALLVAGFFVARRRRRKRSRIDGGDLVDHAGLLVPRMFTFKELNKATRSFSSSEMLGRGGFGAVYKGTLPSGVAVAVKRMRNESKHGKDSFQAEVASLSHIRHRNLVQLRGWCHEEEQLLLVYDYMCNGSLDQWIFRGETRLPLDLRRSVVSGVAAALAYLHEECPQCVLHRDIKCSNVLLDGDWNAYLGDFGLARLIDHQKMEKTTMMAGTFGYMAPEMPHTGKATKESDVYSFGVLILEVMCGTRALDASAIDRGEGTLVDRVWRAHEAGDVMQVADSRILVLVDDGGSIDEMQEAAASVLITNDVHSSAIKSSRDHAMELSDEKKTMVRNLLHLGLLCCNPKPEARPPMRLVSQLLQGSETIDISNLPPLSSYNLAWRDSFQAEVVTQASSSEWSSFSVQSRDVQSAGEGSFQSTHKLSSRSGKFSSWCTY